MPLGAPSTPPAAPAAPAAPVAAHGPEQPKFFTRIGDWVVNKVKGVFSRGAKLGGLVLEASPPGQLISEGEEAARRMGYETQQKGLFRKIGALIQATNDALVKVLRWPADLAVNTLDFLAGMPGRVANRTCRAVSDSWDIIWKGERSHTEPPAVKNHIGTPPGAAPAHA